MKKEKLSSAIGQIDENIAAEADAVRKQIGKKRVGIGKIVSVAASAAIILLGVTVVRNMPAEIEAEIPPKYR